MIPGTAAAAIRSGSSNTAAFQAPPFNSVGPESGAGYLRGCFTSVLDLAIARNIRLGGNRNIHLRVDMFNAPNSAIVTGRNSTVDFNSLSDPSVTNLPFESAGNVIEARTTPRGAGFGVANAYRRRGASRRR